MLCKGLERDDGVEVATTPVRASAAAARSGRGRSHSVASATPAAHDGDVDLQPPAGCQRIGRLMLRPRDFIRCQRPEYAATVRGVARLQGFPCVPRFVRSAAQDVLMPERLLDSSDERRTLVLVVALRVLRDPVLALDASNEALATSSAVADDAGALECLGRVVEVAGRDRRIPSVERRRQGVQSDIVRVGPELRNELHALGACRLARGGEPFALGEDVMRIVARLERDAPNIRVLGSIASSRLVVALQTEVADRDGD
jgi:hypothetical protein